MYEALSMSKILKGVILQMVCLISLTFTIIQEGILEEVLGHSQFCLGGAVLGNESRAFAPSYILSPL